MHGNEGKENERASKLVGKQIVGNSLILTGIKGLHLYKLLRRDFMKKHSPKPLSSDAYCGFQHPDFSHIYNDEVYSSTLYLFKSIIPSFADLINSNSIVLFHSKHLIQL